MSEVPQPQWVLYVYKAGRLVQMQVMATAPAVPDKGAQFAYVDQKSGEHGFGVVERVDQIADPETNSVTVHLT